MAIWINVADYVLTQLIRQSSIHKNIKTLFADENKAIKVFKMYKNYVLKAQNV